MALAAVTLDDKYTLEQGRIYLTGTQALARQIIAACHAGDAAAAVPLAATAELAFRRAEAPLRSAVGARAAARGTAA